MDNSMDAGNSSKEIIFVLPAPCVHLCIKRRLAAYKMTIFGDDSFNQGWCQEFPDTGAKVPDRGLNKGSVKISII